MTFKNSKYFVMLALTVSGLGQAHAAACDGLQISAQSALIDLNTQSMTPITISVSRTGSGKCDFFVTADNAGYSSYLTRKIRHGQDFIPFQLYKDAGKANILKSCAEASSDNDVLVGSFSGSSTTPINLTYYPWVDSSFSVPNGPYLESYKFDLYAGTVASKSCNSSRDSKSTNMKYDKGGYVELSLVDTGAVYNANDTSQTLNFGNLVTGAVRSFDLMLKYNGGYKLSMASVNASNIKSGTRLIPYTMTLNGGGITLTTTSTIVRTNAADGGGSTSPSTGLRLPVSVTMGVVGTSPTGTYTDTVAITVASP